MCMCMYIYIHMYMCVMCVRFGIYFKPDELMFPGLYFIEAIWKSENAVLEI